MIWGTWGGSFKTNNMKTAVEWFYENTQDYVILSDTIPMVIKIEVPFEKYMNILKQAKEKEKEQMLNQWQRGFDDAKYIYEPKNKL